MNGTGSSLQSPPGQPRGLPLLAWGGAAVSLLLIVVTVRALGSYALLFPADAARDRNDYDRAVRFYAAARAWDPANWRAWIGLGQIAKNRAAYLETDPARGRALTAESMALYRKAAAMNPLEVAIPNAMSHLYTLEGDPEKSLACARECVRLAPARSFFYTRLGVQLRRMGRDEEATAQFLEALRRDGSDATARLNLRAIEATRPAK